MNELGLPSFGREPSFAADEAAYDVVVRSALGRRRTRAVAGTSATAAMAVVAVVALGGLNGATRASVEPADEPFPTASWSPPAERRVVPGPGPTNVPDVPRALASAFPHAFPSPSPTQAPRDEEPRPSATAQPPREEGWPTLQWTESLATVKDRPEERCTRLEAADGWCFRYLGPDSLRSGEAATFVSELCRMSTARSQGRVDFEYDPDVGISLTSPTGTPDDQRQMAISFYGLPRRPHVESVPVGQCLRWTHEWTGLDVHGRPMKPGAYTLAVWVIGDVPREPVPGRSDGTLSFWHQDTAFDVS